MLAAKIRVRDATRFVSIGQITIPLLNLATFALALALTFGMWAFLLKTRSGRRIRATAQNLVAARLYGVEPRHLYALTFAIGAALAGIGAILYCCKYPQVKPTTGYLLGLKAFVAAVLGGIGSIPGAMLGGLAIGIAEVVVTALGYSTWTDAVVFAILIVVLLVKPTGFMGADVREKV